MRIAIKTACVMLLLSVLLLATAGWRGGGFGGGRSFGGFGGGSRSFGGFRSSSPSYRYRGGYYGGYYGFGPGIGFYHRMTPLGLALLLAIAGIAVVVVGGAAVARWYSTRGALLTVGVNLRRGKHYAQALDHLMEAADFSTPAGRASALHRAANMVDTDDVVDGYVTVLDRMGDPTALGERAERIAREQMKHVGIDPNVVNVADAQGTAVQLDARAGSDSQTDSDGCVLGIVAVSRASVVRRVSSGREKDALETLRLLHETRGSDFGSLYMFYAPNTGERLDPDAANRVFLDLRAMVAV